MNKPTPIEHYLRRVVVLLILINAALAGALYHAATRPMVHTSAIFPLLPKAPEKRVFLSPQPQPNLKYHERS